MENRVEIAGINGSHEDECPVDNVSSCNSVVYTADQTFPRKILLENFTTEACNKCPDGHKTLNNVLTGRTDVIWVSHHAGYYTDDFTLPESEMLLPFYNSNSTFAPAVMLDRTLFPSALSSGNPVAPVFSVSTSKLNNGLKEAAKIPSFVSVNIDAQYEPESRLLSVSVSGNATAPLSGDSLLLTIYLTEDGIFSNKQSGSYGTYTHNHLLRAVLTNGYGDPVGLPADTYASKTYTCTLPADWKPGNMNIVAFVNNLNIYNVLDCRVMNSETVSLAHLLSVNETDADDGLTVYADGGVLHIEGAYDRLDLYTADGSLVKTSDLPVSAIEVPGLESGVYLVRIISNGRVSVCKVVL